MKRRREWMVACAAAGLCFAAAPVVAQDAFPSKPLRLVVPYPPGQSGDTVARLVAQKIAQTLGQAVVVENKAGAAAIIGMNVVKAAPPDGYTLVYASTGPLAINPVLYEKLSYDARKDFAAVGLVNSAPQLLVVNPKVPAQNMSELLGWLKGDPKADVDRRNFGSGGVGFTNHLTMEMFKLRTGLQLTHVPYTGDAAAVNALMAGDTDTVFLSTTVAAPLVKAGKIRALAVSTKSRSQLMPELPTLAEAGVPGFDAASWGILMVPAGTPAPVIARLNAHLQTALDDAEVRERLQGMGLTVLKADPAQSSAFVASEQASWGAAVKASGARAD